MKSSDTCYYMSITKEENSAFVVSEKQTECKPTIPKDQTACSLLSNEKKLGDAEENTGQQKKPDGSNVAQYELPQVILQAPASSTPNASPSRINQANTVSSANFTVAGCECHSWITAQSGSNSHKVFEFDSLFSCICLTCSVSSVVKITLKINITLGY